MPKLIQLPLVSVDAVTLRRVICDGEDGDHDACERFDRARIIVVLSGSFALEEGRRRVIIDPSTALFVRPCRELRIRHPRGDGDVSLSIAGTLADELTAQADGARPLSPSGYLRLQRLASTRVPACDVRALGFEETITDSLGPSTSSLTLGTKRERDIATAIASELAINFDERLSLSRLAGAVGVSSFHACRVFRRVIGKSIHQHQLELRLRHALALVVETKFDLVRIALDVGFANHGHFTNHFTRRFGVPPSTARTRIGRERLLQAADASTHHCPSPFRHRGAPPSSRPLRTHREDWQP
jgi:AraC-like DNA-binding protein